MRMTIIERSRACDYWLRGGSGRYGMMYSVVLDLIGECAMCLSIDLSI